MFVIKSFDLQLVMAEGLHPENVAVGWNKILPALCLASVDIVKKECRLFTGCFLIDNRCSVFTHRDYLNNGELLTVRVAFALCCS
jgi:hypothetical protein